MWRKWYTLKGAYDCDGVTRARRMRARPRMTARLVRASASHCACPLYRRRWRRGRLCYSTTIADGASSQEAQTMVINVTSLPAGAQYRVFKTTANGGSFFGNPQNLVLGREYGNCVRCWFRPIAVKFNSLTVMWNSTSCQSTARSATNAMRWIRRTPISECNQFVSRSQRQLATCS